MKIKRILNQHKQDFNAIFECEHCGDEIERMGQDERNFHENIIPEMSCRKCGKKADKHCLNLSTKSE